jgi:hypothetical protein
MHEANPISQLSRAAGCAPLLREEIRQAGIATDDARAALRLGVGGTGSCASLIALLCLMNLEPRLGYPFMALGFIGLAGLALGSSALAGAVLAVPGAAAYRRLRRERLRRKLAGLSREQLAAVLLPLREEPLRDTRAIVSPLLRQFGLLDSELAPSDTPAGDGREAAPPPAP